MNTIVRLCVALLAVAVVFAGLHELLSLVGPIPQAAVAPAILYGLIALFGHRRSLAKPEPMKPRRFVPRRRALPPAPGGDT